MIVRLTEEVELELMHTWRSPAGASKKSCAMLLPNGSVLAPFAELPAGSQISTRQPLSINHYTDTSLAACERKARLTRFRAALKQRLRHGRDCESKLDVHMAVCATPYLQRTPTRPTRAVACSLASGMCYRARTRQKRKSMECHAGSPPFAPFW